MSFRKSKNAVDEWRAFCERNQQTISELNRLTPLFSDSARFDEFLKTGVFSRDGVVLTIMSLADVEWEAFAQLVEQFSTEWQSYFERSDYVAYYRERERRRWRPASLGLERGDLQRPRLVVHFWASWDAHDRTMDAALRQVAEQLPQLTFRSVDVDATELRDICLAAKVVNVPSLGFYCAGQLDRLMVGVRAAEEIAVDIRQWLAASQA